MSLTEVFNYKLKQFESVFGKLHEIRNENDIIRKHELTKENKLENIKLDTRVLSDPSEKWETLSFKIQLNGNMEFVKCKITQDKAELVEQIQGLKEGDDVSLVLNPWNNPKSGKTVYYINSVMPVQQVNADVQAGVAQSDNNASLDNGDPGLASSGPIQQEIGETAREMPSSPVSPPMTQSDLSLKDVGIFACCAVKEGFATFRAIVGAGAEVDIKVVGDYCDLAMDKIIGNFNRYTGK